MSSRVDYYYRQRVTEAELDLGFEQLEQADRDLARDIGVFGIVNEMVAHEKLAVPDLTLEITARGATRTAVSLYPSDRFGINSEVFCKRFRREPGSMYRSIGVEHRISRGSRLTRLK